MKNDKTAYKVYNHNYDGKVNSKWNKTIRQKIVEQIFSQIPFFYDKLNNFYKGVVGK